jgi:ribosomal protein S18 acetylase RimI-like enzyme
VDEEVLSRPQEILSAGGAIFLARRQEGIVGTCALLCAGEERYELAKMAVTAGSQGLGIGRKLLGAAIERYQASGGRELFLESNSRLEPALALYESAGFVHAPRPFESHYERADVCMVYRAAGAGKPA